MQQKNILHFTAIHLKILRSTAVRARKDCQEFIKPGQLFGKAVTCFPCQRIAFLEGDYPSTFARKVIFSKLSQG